MKNVSLQAFSARILGISIFFMALLLMHDLSFATNSKDNVSHAPITSQFTQNQDPTSEVSDIERLMTMRSILQEHTALAHIVTVNRYENSSEYKASLNAMNTNSRLLSEEIGARYGEDAQNNFLERWQHHINLYIAYTDALKADDQERQQQVRDELQVWSTDMAAFMTQGENTDQQDELREHFRNHVELTISVINEHGNDNHEREYETAHEAFVQAGEMAETITPILFE